MVILALMKQLFLLHNALVILLTKILVITKRNIWLITNHSSHHWIFSLTRSMMTFLVYIENQNFTRIHIEEIILQILILFQQANCWWIWLTFWLLSKREYNHITNNEVFSNGLKVSDLIDVILLEGPIRNVQLRDIGTIGYTWHMTKTSKHKKHNTTQTTRKMSNMGLTKCN